MTTFIKTLILLSFTGCLYAQNWPSAAIPDPDLALPGPLDGKLSVCVNGAYMKSSGWTDQRSRITLGLGLGRGIGFSACGAMRDLSGLGAFQKGPEDTRLGLSFWPQFSRHFALGLNGYFIVPTGYHKQEVFYSAATDTTGTLPLFSLKQTGGELYAGAAWAIAPAAEVGANIGYFSTADKLEQAFRWGMNATLAPFGPRAAVELNYASSITRIGSLPNTEIFTTGLAVQAGWGFSVVPGLWAELKDEPVYGASIGLRFSAHIPQAAVFQTQEQVLAEIEERHIAGRVLIAPPLSRNDLADRDLLWKSIQDNVQGVFDDTEPLTSLDVPGLPYNDRDRDQQESSLRAIAAAHPQMEWLLISKVEQEDVSKQGGVSIPLLVAQPTWTALCKMQFRLVNLKDRALDRTLRIDGKAEKRSAPLLPMMSSVENNVLSFSESRELTFAAYREAGRKIALALRDAP
jgi:hypothetical protein